MNQIESVQIVGFAGRKGSGKDTCAGVLVERGFRQYAFAKPLKDACRHVFDLTEEQLYGDDRETPDVRYGKTPRQLMQLFGVEFIRTHVGEAFWVDKFKAFVDAHDGPVVVSDVRFQNEVDCIKDVGGKVYLVDRASVSRDDSHVSEKAEELEGLSGVVKNDGTVQQLKAAVTAVMS